MKEMKSKVAKTRKRVDHDCHAEYRDHGYISIDLAAEILDMSQDKARDVLKKYGCRAHSVNKHGNGRPLNVFSEQDVHACRAKNSGVNPSYCYGRRLLKEVPKKPEGDKTVYQPTYEDFFLWCSRDRAWPKIFFEDYVKLANLDDSCNHEIVKFAIGTAMRECWVSWFDKIKKYLTDIVGTKKTERNEHPVFGCGMLKPGYIEWMRRLAASMAVEKKGGVK